MSDKARALGSLESICRPEAPLMQGGQSVEENSLRQEDGRCFLKPHKASGHPSSREKRCIPRTAALLEVAGENGENGNLGILR